MKKVFAQVAITTVFVLTFSQFSQPSEQAEVQPAKPEDWHLQYTEKEDRFGPRGELCETVAKITISRNGHQCCLKWKGNCDSSVSYRRNEHEEFKLVTDWKASPEEMLFCGLALREANKHLAKNPKTIRSINEDLTTITKVPFSLWTETTEKSLEDMQQNGVWTQIGKGRNRLLSRRSNLEKFEGQSVRGVEGSKRMAGDLLFRTLVTQQPKSKLLLLIHNNYHNETNRVTPETFCTKLYAYAHCYLTGHTDANYERNKQNDAREALLACHLYLKSSPLPLENDRLFTGLLFDDDTDPEQELRKEIDRFCDSPLPGIIERLRANIQENNRKLLI